MPGRFFQDLDSYINKGKRATKTFTINDDRGNPISLRNLDIPVNGVYRTRLDSNNPTTVMDKSSLPYPGEVPFGFTPEALYYSGGATLSSDSTGLPIGYGNVLSNVSRRNNTAADKLFRTDLNYTFVDGRFPGNSLFLTDLNPRLISKTASFNPDYKFQGWLDPSFYINNPYHYDITRNTYKTSPSKNIYSDNVPLDGKKGKYQVFREFYDDGQFKFAHNLDPVNQIKSLDSSALSNKIRDKFKLGSFIATLGDNEDPVMFGYDIFINQTTSPLFNGAILNFINQFQDDPELNSRRDILTNFYYQFSKFFKIYPRIGENIPDVLFNPNGATNSYNRYDYRKLPNVAVTDDLEGIPKTYYLKKISGLDKLIERNTSVTDDTINSMVDYGKDLIKLTIYEDVTVNTGYLATLYKMLSWSRLNGKNIIPENLLRFDAEIEITEIRNYNRVIKNFNNKEELDVFSDLLTKYSYTLYDCQFSFNELSHGDQIDMSKPELTDSFEISFNYKYSTLALSKFGFSGETGTSSTIDSYEFRLDNSKVDVLEIFSNKANDIVTNNGSIQVGNKYISKDSYGKYPSSLRENITTSNLDAQKSRADDQANGKINGRDNGNKSNLERAQLSGTPTDNLPEGPRNELDKAKRNDRNNKLLRQLGTRLRQSAVREVNRQISVQARLLNRTLDNIRNSIGLGRINAPTNVYTQSLLEIDIRNSFRRFIGDSVRGFFSKE
jgi:hypothetical protein